MSQEEQTLAEGIEAANTNAVENNNVADPNSFEAYAVAERLATENREYAEAYASMETKVSVFPQPAEFAADKPKTAAHGLIRKQELDALKAYVALENKNATLMENVKKLEEQVNQKQSAAMTAHVKNLPTTQQKPEVAAAVDNKTMSLLRQRRLNMQKASAK